MAIRFDCSTCGIKMSAPDGTSGKTVKCPKCGNRMKIPNVSGPSLRSVAQAKRISKPLILGATVLVILVGIAGLLLALRNPKARKFLGEEPPPARQADGATRSPQKGEETHPPRAASAPGSGTAQTGPLYPIPGAPLPKAPPTTVPAGDSVKTEPGNLQAKPEAAAAKPEHLKDKESREKSPSVGDQKGQTALAKSLLEKAADTLTEPGQVTPLHMAAREGNTEFAKLLLSKGANVNAEWEDIILFEKGVTPLHEAAKGGHKEVAELLLARGAKLSALANTDEMYGCTPLDIAIVNGHKEMADLLLRKGAVFKPGESGDLLRLAVARGHRNMVAWLLDKGVDVNASDSMGCTPLHKAAENGCR